MTRDTWMTALLDILGDITLCSDVRGFLKHGPSYWRRTRAIERWRHSKETQQ